MIVDLMKGTIRERGKGRWQAQVYAGRGLDGRERRVARTITGTKKDAELALARLVTEVAAGQIRPHDRITVAELLDRWLARGAPDWSPATLSTNRQQARDHVAAHIGEVSVDRLRPADIDLLYARLRTRLAGPTVDRIHSSVLHPALNRAVRWQMIASNPADGYEPPERDDGEVTPPSVDQVKALIAAAEPWFAVYLRIAASTGARRGTLAALRWKTVDLEARTIRFERALTTGQVEKANKGRRAFTATPGAGDVAALTAHRRAMAERAIAVGSHLGLDAYVWSPEPDCGTPYWTSSISREFARTRSRAGIDDVKLHHVKHFAVTQMLAAGAPVREVAQRTGTTPATIERVYAHWIPGGDAGAAAIMDRLLG